MNSRSTVWVATRVLPAPVGSSTIAFWRGPSRRRLSEDARRSSLMLFWNLCSGLSLTAPGTTNSSGLRLIPLAGELRRRSPSSAATRWPRAARPRRGDVAGSPPAGSGRRGSAASPIRRRSGTGPRPTCRRRPDPALRAPATGRGQGVAQVVVAEVDLEPLRVGRCAFASCAAPRDDGRDRPAGRVELCVVERSSNASLMNRRIWRSSASPPTTSLQPSRCQSIVWSSTPSSVVTRFAISPLVRASRCRACRPRLVPQAGVDVDDPLAVLAALDEHREGEAVLEAATPDQPAPARRPVPRSRAGRRVPWTEEVLLLVGGREVDGARGAGLHRPAHAGGKLPGPSREPDLRGGDDELDEYSVIDSRQGRSDSRASP